MSTTTPIGPTVREPAQDLPSRGELVDAALALAAKRWPVFPVKPRGKTPLTGGHGHKDATTDPARIEDWWAKTPAANVAIATGDIVVIDIDGAVGESSLAVLTKQYGPFPETLQSSTGKGRHFFFASTGSTIRNDTGRKLGAGIDVRGLGGYAVVPPSVHESGKKYEWVCDYPPAELPSWLQKKLSGTTPQAAKNNDNGHPHIPVGQRNSRLASVAGSMRKCGLSPAAILAGLLEHNRQVCDPPLPEPEVRNIAESVGRYPSGELQEAAVQSAKVEIYTPGQIMGLSSEAVEYICYGLAPKGMIASVDGPPKTSGKSTMTMMGIDAALSGKLFLNHATSRVPILFVTEESPRTVRLLLERCGLTNIAGLYILPASRSALPWSQLALEIEKQCAALKIGWLIVDTFHGVAGLEGDAENDAGAVVQALTPLRRISATLDVAVTTTRHTRKSGGQIGESGRGSSAFTGFVDTILELKRLPGNQSITKRQLEVTGRLEQSRMEIELRDGSYIVAPDPDVDSSIGEAERLTNAIAANPRASKRQLEEQTGIGRNRLEKIAGKSGWLFGESGWERSGS
jgi:hypothetical protein